MKKMGEASVLELILNSNVLPNVVKAYSEPLASAYGKIDSITMYGEGNTAKLAQDIAKDGTQILQSLNQTLGLDIRSIIAGYLGGKLSDSGKQDKEEKDNN